MKHNQNFLDGQLVQIFLNLFSTLERVPKIEQDGEGRLRSWKTLRSVADQGIKAEE